MPVYIFLTCLIVYALTNHGGIKEPDGEIVFRTSESLESGRVFALKEDLLDWKGFGTAPGKDGKLYSVFGPGEALLYALPVAAAKLINQSGWYKKAKFQIPKSYYIDGGLEKFMSGVKTKNTEVHAVRFLVSFCNIFVSALSVIVFWFIILRMAGSLKSAYAVTMTYALATLAWPYSGTFFSEPAAVLFIMISFYFIIRENPQLRCYSKKSSSSGIFVSGLSLGMAAATHVTAMLFLPFFAFLGAYFCRLSGKESKKALIQTLYFLLGFGIIMLFLGLHNYARFGDFLETGRTVNPGDVKKFGYGYFTAPWAGIYGLLLSSGKGMLFYCPAVILGILSWRLFHKKYPVLSFVLLSAICFRFIFIASRSDWSGGFCVGPRYMVMIIPFLILPAYLLFDRIFQEKQKKAVIASITAGFFCVLQQLYFCTGEIFSYYRMIRDTYARAGIDLFKNNRIYFTWEYSPLFGLLGSHKGPFILQNTGLNSGIFIAAVMTIIAFFLFFGFMILRRASAIERGDL
jgi:hypothetical protein